MAHPGDNLVDLLTRQLAALAGLRALGHLDLQLVGVDQILTGDAEASRRDLLHRAAPPVAVVVADVTRLVLAALTGVALAADAVHRNRQCLVGFLADRAEGHRAGRETVQDRLDRFDLVERHRLCGVLQIEQATNRRQLAAVRVNLVAVLPVQLVVVAARGVLELLDRLRIEGVVLAIAPPLVIAAPVEDRDRGVALGVGTPVTHQHLFGDDVNPDPANPRGCTSEVSFDEFLVEAHCFEDLGTPIGIDRRDAHLRHDLQNALIRRLHKALRALF